MRPNICCNSPLYIVRTWHQDTWLRKLKRIFRAEPLPHRLVEHCRVCGCNHYIMIVPEVPVGITGFEIGAKQ